MKYLIALSLLVGISSSSIAQHWTDKPSKGAYQYAMYRLTLNEPQYGLTKVKRLVRKLKTTGDGDLMMAPQTFDSLSVPERFTYIMIHGEAFNQNCDAGMIDEDARKLIYSELQGPFDQYAWSDKQLKFLRNNRGTVLNLTRKTLQANRHIGINTKNLIEEIDGYELIPMLVSAAARDPRDLDIYTLLMVLMKQGKYQPFLSTVIGKKAYQDPDRFMIPISANAANKKQILEQSMAYYKSREK